jgi:hypothetical protein|tara:strand:- start:19 stop:1107 length:1089 start_codon:yes stop_codon:yes gene_type:complete
MSFLDNCGSIQLDAILTDLGRKRMAQGKFEVKKFALGDDEIDYALFDKTAMADAYEPDGSWNADRKLLSQSCFEAFAETSAVINYGLTNFERNDILYLPVLSLNYKGSALSPVASVTRTLPREIPGFARPSGSVFYLSVNDETTTKLKNEFKNMNYILESNNTTNTKVVVESGLDTDSTGAPSGVVMANKKNRETFILRTGLLDSHYTVYADSRFFSQILGPPKSAEFKTGAGGALKENFTPLEFSTKVSLETIIDKFDVYMLRGVPNHVYRPTGTASDSNISAIRGPRGSVLALGFATLNELGGSSTATRDQKYTTFGKTDQTVFGGSNKYDYIDTTIYVAGMTSNARTQIPLRIIRYAGT